MPDRQARSAAASHRLQTLAALLWLPQAGLIAWALQRLADGHGVPGVVLTALGFLLLAFVRAGCDAVGSRGLFVNARQQLGQTRRRLARVIARLDPLDRQRPQAGAAASVLAEQADALLPAATRFEPARQRALLVPLAILLTILPFSWVAALILLGSAPMIPLFMVVIGWRARAASEAHLAELGLLQGFLLDRLRGLATLRALGAVGRTADRLGQASTALRERVMKVLRIAFLSSAVLELFAALGVALVAVYIGFHLLGDLRFGAWGRTLSLGEAVFILLLAPAFFEPLREVAAAWHDRAAAQAAEEAAQALQQARTSVPVWSSPRADRGDGSEARPGGQVRPSGPPEVVLEQVGFAYPGLALEVLQAIDLKVTPGERIALVGPSGSGKSTLLALIAGLATPGQGRLLVGGTPLGPRTVERVQQRIGWLSARPWLRARSIRDNVTLGRKIEPDRIGEALHLAGLGGLLARRGLAIDAAEAAHPAARLSEAGDGLSGGEWVRIALARAIVEPQRDLLLVDEPTAHLDAVTATEITATLLAAAVGRTLIVATHDPALAARMDRIITLAPDDLWSAANGRRRAAR